MASFCLFRARDVSGAAVGPREPTRRAPRRLCPQRRGGGRRQQPPMGCVGPRHVPLGLERRCPASPLPHMRMLDGRPNGRCISPRRDELRHEAVARRVVVGDRADHLSAATVLVSTSWIAENGSQWPRLDPVLPEVSDGPNRCRHRDGPSCPHRVPAERRGDVDRVAARRGLPPKVEVHQVLASFEGACGGGVGGGDDPCGRRQDPGDDRARRRPTAHVHERSGIRVEHRVGREVHPRGPEEVLHHEAVLLGVVVGQRADDLPAAGSAGGSG